MKNFLSFFSPKNLGDIVQTLWTRFPIPSILVLINTGFIWYQVNSTLEDSARIMRVILTLVVTFFLSTSVAIFGESQKPNNYTRWLPLLPILYGVGFFFAIRSLDMNSGVFNEPFIYFSLHLVGFIAGVFFTPYIFRQTNQEREDIQYTNYFTQVAWAFCMSAIVGGVLMALGAIAISAVGALFDINTLISEWKMYENWAIVALSLAPPVYGLMHLPRKNEVTTREYVVNKFFAFIIRFVVIPFVIIYFCILYAYSVKVLLNISDWPKGEVSWLVIGFSIFGYLAYIFSKPYEEEHTVVRVFRRFFPFAVIPQIPMLGYAIVLRINQYDLTMNRYFVVVFGLWLTLISLYFVLGKIKSLTIIPATLTVITLLISLGPWGVYQLPLTRQYNRLIYNLETSGILQKDGSISPAPESLDRNLENEIYSGIEYVCRFEDCNRIKTLFTNILTESEKIDKENWTEDPYNSGKTYPGMTTWTIVSEVTKGIGVDWQYDEVSGRERKYLMYSTKKGDGLYDAPLSVAGYTTFYTITSYPPGEVYKERGYILVNPETEELILQEENGIKTVFALKEINRTLGEKYGNRDNTSLSNAALTFDLTANGKTVRAIFQNYSIKNPNFSEKDNREYAGISGYALVK